MQNSDNVTIPTLEELQQRFHAVQRFRDPNKREYVWFHADDVARVFGYSDFNEELKYYINHVNRVCVGKPIYEGIPVVVRAQSRDSLGPECNSILDKWYNVINGGIVYYYSTIVASNEQREKGRFKPWCFQIFSLKKKRAKSEVKKSHSIGMAALRISYINMEVYI